MNREPPAAGRSAQVRRLPLPRGTRAQASPERRLREGSGIVVAPPRYALAHALARSLGQPLVGGNRVELLHGGEPAWAALFAAIDRAREHINLESPAFVAPGLAASLAQRLMERAGAGVRVNLLLDGSRPGAARDTALLRRAGITVCPSHWLARARTLLGRAAHQHTQRSLVVIDGCVAFLGGLAPLRSPGAGSCLRVDGPAVAQLQDLFLVRWLRECGTAPPPARYFPPLGPRGTQRTGLAAVDAGWGVQPLRAALLAAIDAARHSVLVSGAPGQCVSRALRLAAERGLEVRVLLPALQGHAGEPAECADQAALLRSGVRVHRRRMAPLHTDACVIDRVWAATASTLDFDRRLHSAELPLIVLDDDFGAGIERLLRGDIARCRELSAPVADAPNAGTGQAASPPTANAWQRGRQWLSERLPTRT